MTNNTNAPTEWVTGPRVATQEMRQAAVVFANGNAVYKNVAAGVLKIEEDIYGEVYAAMLEAAPPAPEAVSALSDDQILSGYRAMFDCIPYVGPEAAIQEFRGDIARKIAAVASEKQS